MNGHNKKSLISGIVFAILIAFPSWFLGRQFPVIGGPVFAIIIGLILGIFYSNDKLVPGISFTAKKILQYSIVLLGFSMNLYNILEVGKNSLLIIVSTISAALITAYLVSKFLKIPQKTAILIGVGSSICGGSAIAATAPAINAESEDVAKAISTIFFFNVIAALIFPSIGKFLGMTDYGFGMFAGTAVNDTSSVVAAATTWSVMAGNNTALEMATIVKLTRTLAIIPITFVLALYTAKKEKSKDQSKDFSLMKIFPWFIVYFLIAAIINTIFSLDPSISSSLVTLGKFMITMAMAAIGFNTDVKSLIQGGIKPILLGLLCWIAVALTSLAAQTLLGIW
nr:YeiH family protein [Tissierella sp.]